MSFCHELRVHSGLNILSHWHLLCGFALLCLHYCSPKAGRPLPFSGAGGGLPEPYRHSPRGAHGISTWGPRGPPWIPMSPTWDSVYIQTQILLMSNREEVVRQNGPPEYAA